MFKKLLSLLSAAVLLTAPMVEAANISTTLNQFPFAINGIDPVYPIRAQIDTTGSYVTLYDSASNQAPVFMGGIFSEGGAAQTVTIAAESESKTGTVATTSGSATITGTGTAFSTEYKAQDQIVITGGDTLTISSIASNTSMTATANASSTVSGAAHKYQRIFLVPELAANQGVWNGLSDSALFAGETGDKIIVKSSAAITNAIFYVGAVNILNGKGVGARFGGR